MSQRQLPVIAAVLSTLAGTSVSLGAGTYGASLNLAGLNGENGFVVRGINGGDISGRPSSGGGISTAMVSMTSLSGRTPLTPADAPRLEKRTSSLAVLGSVPVVSSASGA